MESLYCEKLVTFAKTIATILNGSHFLVRTFKVAFAHKVMMQLSTPQTDSQNHFPFFLKCDTRPEAALKDLIAKLSFISAYR